MTAPAWERRLRLAVELYELAVAGYRIVGNAGAVESARLEVVAVIDRTITEGVPEQEIDLALGRIAAENDDGRARTRPIATAEGPDAQRGGEAEG